jgi:hypothetical protein
MGQREVKRKNPRYTHGFIDRHGMPRFYIRLPGPERNRVPLAGFAMVAGIYGGT